MNALKCQWVAPPPQAVLAVQKVDPHKLSGPLKIIIISHAQLTRPLDRIEAGDGDGGGHALRCLKSDSQLAKACAKNAILPINLGDQMPPSSY